MLCGASGCSTRSLKRAPAHSVTGNSAIFSLSCMLFLLSCGAGGKCSASLTFTVDCLPHPESTGRVRAVDGRFLLRPVPCFLHPANQRVAGADVLAVRHPGVVGLHQPLLGGLSAHAGFTRAEVVIQTGIPNLAGLQQGLRSAYRVDMIPPQRRGPDVVKP